VAAPEANRAACSLAAERAAELGAQIVILPELANSGYVFHDEPEARTLAEPLHGPTTTDWLNLAGRLGIILVGGICELGDDGRLYNSAVIIGGSSLRASYRKAHLWDTEKLVFAPGGEPPPIAEVDGLRLAVMICYDLEFPEWVRLPALAGAELLCVPANWPRLPRPGGERPMEVVRAQSAAAVNRIFIAVCDRVGHERGVDWVGGSAIIDPDGWPLAGPEPGDQERILVADCDLRAAADKAVSERNDVLADRRPELYRRLLEDHGLAGDGGLIAGGPEMAADDEDGVRWQGGGGTR